MLWYGVFPGNRFTVESGHLSYEEAYKSILATAKSYDLTLIGVVKADSFVNAKKQLELLE